MWDEYKVTYPTDLQSAENRSSDARKIFKTTSEPLFHYTSREVFWKIIEGESFLARHILFSNDSEEHELGSRVIWEKIQKSNDSAGEMPVANEKYMVCFCEDDDLLSQWRGYAKNGIAMKFDFSLGTYGSAEQGPFSSYHCFTIANRGSLPTRLEVQAAKCGENEKFETRYVSQDVGNQDKYVTLCVTAPYKVYYIDKQKEDTEFGDAVASMKQYDDMEMVASKVVPYIKNKKFKEEKEYRLIFNLTDLYKPEMECFIGGKIEYLDLDNVKKPNIRVEFGDARNWLSKDPVKVYFKNTAYEPFLNQLAEEMQQSANPVMIQPELVDQDVLKADEILLSIGKNQEKVAWKLYQLFLLHKKEFAKTKLWCDGHLPIRQIIVGPSKDAELMRKSIEQYKNNKYWMKSVDVKISEIPYRD